MNDAGIEDKYKSQTGLDHQDETVVEDRTYDYRKQRQYPQRNEVAVGKSDNAGHYEAGKRNDSVLGAVSTRIGSVGKPGNDIKQGIYAKRNQYPESDIRDQWLAEILDAVIVDRKADLKQQTYDRYYENEFLKFKPYRSFQIPQRGIARRLAFHSIVPLQLIILSVPVLKYLIDSPTSVQVRRSLFPLQSDQHCFPPDPLFLPWDQSQTG